MNEEGGGYINDFYAREFWRFVMVQQAVANLAQTAIEFPPMQAPASFNLSAIKAKIEETLNQQHGQ
jgi:arylsulfatase